PEYQGRAITKYSQDDGQEILELAWTADERAVVFVRGGGANRQGEIPNPISDPAGVEQAIWRVALQGGDPVRVAAGNSLAVSPKGDGIAFTRGGDVWFATFTENAAAAQLIEARGGEATLKWSPDGAKLAFTSGRGDHSYVGIYDVVSKTIRWTSPSVDNDANPIWSPDGTRIAFTRRPTSAALTIFRPVREATPWTIRVADASTGESREVWRADAGRGSAYWGIVGETQLLWTADDRIVFPWEKTGWVSLYSIPSEGGRATQLTSGEFEVEYVALGADRRSVIYNSNQGDVDRRHIWRVSTRGGAPQQLTRGGIEWAPVPLANGALAYLRADERTPAHAAIALTDQARALAANAVPADWPAEQLVTPQAVEVVAADGKIAPAQLFMPRGARAGDHRPAVIFLHGGSRRQMLLGFNYGPYYHNAYSLNQYFVSRGFVVLSLNYRSGIGYGMEFREALNYGATGGSEFYDVLGAGLYLRGRPEVDPSRIGLWGGSYGGYLTAMGLSRASDLFAAGVDIHGVHDWNVGIRTFIPSYNVLERPEEARVAFHASPMSTIDSWRSPVLVIHGDDDRNVSFAETVTLVEELRKRGVQVEQLVFPDEVHSFLRHANWLAAYGATAHFLERNLGQPRTSAR
ncbi:MAG: S9 family peptidase, partial [Longimicrobiales bacterium]